MWTNFTQTFPLTASSEGHSHELLKLVSANMPLKSFKQKTAKKDET